MSSSKMSSQKGDEPPAAACVEVVILDEVAVDANSIDLAVAEGDKAAVDANSIDLAVAGGTEGGGKRRSIVGEEGMAFWHYSLGLSFMALFVVFALQVLMWYGSIQIELSSLAFKARLRGLPWLPSMSLWAASAAVSFASNLLAEDAAWPWASITTISAFIFIMPGAVFAAFPGQGWNLQSCISCTSLVIALFLQDRYLFKRIGMTPQDQKSYMKSQALLVGTIYFSFIGGGSAMTLFSVFENLAPVLPDLMLTLILAAVERLCLLTATKSAQLAPTFSPPRLLSWILLGSSGVIEAFRLAAMMAPTMRNPQSRNYIAVLGTTFLLNTSFRTGWTNYWLCKVTKKAMFVPTIPNLLMREVKLTSGYGRVTFATSLMLARWFNSTEAPWYFNETVAYVVVLTIAETLVEDLVVLALKKIKWVPSLGEFEQAHYTSLRDDSFHKAYTWSSDEQAVRTYATKSPPLGLELFMQLFVQSCSAYMVFFGLAPLVSVKYLFGLEAEPAATAVDGAFIWLSWS